MFVPDKLKPVIVPLALILPEAVMLPNTFKKGVPLPLIVVEPVIEVLPPNDVTPSTNKAFHPAFEVETCNVCLGFNKPIPAWPDPDNWKCWWGALPDVPEAAPYFQPPTTDGSVVTVKYLSSTGILFLKLPQFVKVFDPVTIIVSTVKLVNEPDKPVITPLALISPLEVNAVNM